MPFFALGAKGLRTAGGEGGIRIACKNKYLHNNSGDTPHTNYSTNYLRPRLKPSLWSGHAAMRRMLFLNALP